MWDVIWTDPDRELVGEHRARKEKKRVARSDASSRDPHSSTRSSFSTRSSLSSSDAALSFLRSQQGIIKNKATNKGKEKEIVAEGKSSWRSTSWSKASSTASSALASLSIPSARSPLSPTFDIRSRRSSGLATTNESSLHSRPSIASRTTKENEEREPVDDQLLEHSQHDSTPSKRANMSPSEVLFPENSRLPPLHDMPALEIDSTTPGIWPDDSKGSGSSANALFTNKDSTELAVKSPDLSSPLASPSFPSAGFNQPPAVPPKSPLRSASRSCSLISLPGHPGGWLSADEWSQRALSPHTSDDDNTVRDDAKMLDMAALQQELEIMRNSEPETVLSKLQICKEDQDPARSDLERKRSMLCALQHLDRNEPLMVPSEEQKKPVENAPEALILFESKNTAAYLAAQHPAKTFYHVSRHPLRNATFTNLIPLTLSSLSADILSLALPVNLDLIYSLSLPSLCPAPDLTRTLTCLRSQLKPNGGTLHLTLIDALPHPATLGTQLRNWFEKNLIVNLSPHSLSHIPTQLFPECLAAASLRGPGSRRVKTKFFASPASIRGGGTISEEEQQHEDHDPDPAIRKLRTEMRVKAELRCLVGRMLWMEVWGPYISPRVGSKGETDDDAKDKDQVSWWWDDDACLAECLQLGTFWEYHTIEAVRGA